MWYELFWCSVGINIIFCFYFFAGKNKQPLPKPHDVNFEIKNNIIKADVRGGKIFYSSIIDLSRNNLNWWHEGELLKLGPLQSTLTHLFSLQQMKQAFNAPPSPPVSKKPETKPPTGMN